MRDAERRLRDQIRYLEEENRWLRDILAPPGFLPAIFPLTATEESAFKALLSRDQWTKESLLAAIYLDASERDIPDVKIIDVMVCHIRRKIRPLGIEIETFWGGYRMSREMKKRVRDTCQREKEREEAAAAVIYNRIDVANINLHFANTSNTAINQLRVD